MSDKKNPSEGFIAFSNDGGIPPKASVVHAIQPAMNNDAVRAGGIPPKASAQLNGLRPPNPPVTLTERPLVQFAEKALAAQAEKQVPQQAPPKNDGSK